MCLVLVRARGQSLIAIPIVNPAVVSQALAIPGDKIEKAEIEAAIVSSSAESKVESIKKYTFGVTVNSILFTKKMSQEKMSGCKVVPHARIRV